VKVGQKTQPQINKVAGGDNAPPDIFCQLHGFAPAPMTSVASRQRFAPVNPRQPAKKSGNATSLFFFKNKKKQARSAGFFCWGCTGANDVRGFSPKVRAGSFFTAIIMGRPPRASVDLPRGFVAEWLGFLD